MRGEGEGEGEGGESFRCEKNNVYSWLTRLIHNHTIGILSG